MAFLSCLRARFAPIAVRSREHALERLRLWPVALQRRRSGAHGIDDGFRP